jgi:heat-inducible transcriptional repressor
MATCSTGSCSPSAKYSPAELVSAANYINQNYSGHSFEDIRQRLHDELRAIRRT